jgi:ParB family chromosome partitioning protein
MSKIPRKSIVASFGLLSAEIETEENAKPAAVDVPPPAAPQRVGAGVIGAAHRAIDDIRAERDKLRAIVEAGGVAIRDLDPALIDPSPYPDRLADDDAADFEQFKLSIKTDGQKVPIQVRRNPQDAERFQIIYGHRRWRAAKELGLAVKAIEVAMSDLDLVVAQGIENAGRQDLTWIEKALFAFRMDDAGIRARDIYAALSIEDAELARMRGVYRAIPTDIIEAIGRCPKIGRPRWQQLAKLIATDINTVEKARSTLRAIASQPPLSSDQRFVAVLASLKPSQDPQERNSENTLADASGVRLATWSRSESDFRISAENGLGSAFLAYLEDALPSLAERFSQNKTNSKP